MRFTVKPYGHDFEIVDGGQQIAIIKARREWSEKVLIAPFPDAQAAALASAEHIAALLNNAASLEA